MLAAEGDSKIHGHIYKDPSKHVPELQRLGADIDVFRQYCTRSRRQKNEPAQSLCRATLGQAHRLYSPL